MNTNSPLPTLSQEEKGNIALRIITSEMIFSGNWFAKPNDTRRRLIAAAKEIEVEPNKLLALIHELTQPQLEQIFKPITAEDITAYEKEREERRKQRESQKMISSMSDAKREALAAQDRR